MPYGLWLRVATTYIYLYTEASFNLQSMEQDWGKRVTWRGLQLECRGLRWRRSHPEGCRRAHAVLCVL